MMRKINLCLIACVSFMLIWSGNVQSKGLIEAEKSVKWGERTALGMLDNCSPCEELDELVVYSETFDDVNTWPVGWEAVNLVGQGNVNWFLTEDARASMHTLDDTAPYAFLDVDADGSRDDGVRNYDAALVSPAIEFGEIEDLKVEFDSYFRGGVSYSLEISTDGGTEWVEVHRFMASSYSTRHEEVSLLHYVGDATSMKLRYHYSSYQGWRYCAGVDNIVVTSYDEDIITPVISLQTTPKKYYYNEDDFNIAVTVQDHNAITNVILEYGTWNDGAVGNIQTLEMIHNVETGQYEGLLDLTSFSFGDEIDFCVKATDENGNTGRCPESEGRWKSFDVWDRIAQPYKFTEIDYEWIDITDSGTQLADSDDDRTSLVLDDLGLSAVNYYSVEYDSVFISPNGWVSFTNSTSGSNPAPSFPSESKPNAYLALFHADMSSEQEGSGHIYYEVQGEKLIISYDGVCIYGQSDKKVAAQVIIDPANGVFQYNFKNVIFADAPDYTRRHLVGFENGVGTLGDYLYRGEDFGFPANETSYFLGQSVGIISGSVVNVAEEPMEGVLLKARVADTSDLMRQDITPMDGSFSLMGLEAGLYDVEVSFPSYTTLVLEDVLVEAHQTTTLQITLHEEVVTRELAGYVYDADAVGENTPVANVALRLVEFDQMVTTDEDGRYTFGQQPLGQYTIEVNNSIALVGYHDAIHVVDLGEETGDSDFRLKQILKPVNLSATMNDLEMTLTFDAPGNHVQSVDYERRICQLKDYVCAHELNEKCFPDIEAIRKDLSQMEAIYEYNNCEVNELDAIEDVNGYRLRINGEVLLPLFTEIPIVYNSLFNRRENRIAVAADYGYPEDKLVFSEEIVLTPDANVYGIYPETYNWIEIRTNEVGTAARFNEDDCATGLFEFADGNEFELFDDVYSFINICSNGYVMFSELPTYTYRNTTIPSETDPNGYIAVMYDFMETSSSRDYDVWHHFDEDANKFIVTWYVEEWHQYPENVLEFQMILNLDDQSVVFNYKNASHHWPGDTQHGGNSSDGTIGIENSAGNAGAQYNALPENETALRLELPRIRGTISGTVEDSNGNSIEGATVKVGDRIYGTSDQSGEFENLQVNIGTYDVVFEANGYLQETVEGVLVEEATNTEIPAVVLTKPVAEVSPSSINMVCDLAEGAAPVTSSFTLSNVGSGSMGFTITSSPVSGFDRLRNGGNAAGINGGVCAKRLEIKPYSSGPVARTLDAVWDELFSARIDQVIENTRIYGVGYTAAGIHLLSWSNPMNPRENNWYTVSRDGSTLEGVLSFEGLCDLGNDIGYDPITGLFYGIADSGKLYSFNTDLSSVTELHQFSEDLSLVPCSYDWDHQLVYTYDWNESHVFMSYDVQTGDVRTMATPPQEGCVLNSLAYVPCDEDGYTIYGLFDYGYAQGTHMLSKMHRYNPSINEWEETGVMIPDMQVPGGFNTTINFQENRLDFVALSQNTVDESPVKNVSIWEGYEYNAPSWYHLDVTSGTLEAGRECVVTIAVDASNLGYVPFENGESADIAVRVSGPYIADKVVVATVEFVDSGVEDVLSSLPDVYELRQSYPNPFNPSVTIPFALPQNGHVNLAVYNVLGQCVATLVDESFTAGYHQIVWNGKNDRGMASGSGVYFVKMEAGNYQSTQKIIMMK